MTIFMQGDNGNTVIDSDATALAEEVFEGLCTDYRIIELMRRHEMDFNSHEEIMRVVSSILLLGVIYGS